MSERPKIPALFSPEDVERLNEAARPIVEQARRALQAFGQARRHYATGGAMPVPRLDDDHVPAFISPGRSTTKRPGETWTQAMDRLMEGEDL